MKRTATQVRSRASASYSGLLASVVSVLEQARHAAARSVNAVMTATYWEIGRQIVEFEQHGAQRAAYGERLLAQLSLDLGSRFGRGFGVINLQQMRRLYLGWPSPHIRQTLSDESRPAPVAQGPKRILQTASAKSGEGPTG